MRLRYFFSVNYKNCKSDPKNCPSDLQNVQILPTKITHQTYKNCPSNLKTFSTTLLSQLNYHVKPDTNFKFCISCIIYLKEFCPPSPYFSFL